MVHISGAVGASVDIEPMGLAMRLKDLSVTTAEIYNLPLDRIEIDPNFNVRHDGPALRDHLEMLRDSILSSGFLRSKPLIVRQSDDGLSATLVDGHCRFMAAKMAVAAGAELRSVPCVSEGKGVSLKDRTLMLLTANSGLPLTPLEQADAVKRLLSYGWTETEIGSKIGRTRQHVANLLELAAAPDGVRVMVVDGSVSATEAVKVIRAEGAGAVKVLQAAKRQAEANGKSKVTASAIRAVREPDALPPLPPLPRSLQRNAVPLSVAAAHVVEIAKHIRHELPDDMQRAIDALAESLA